MNSDTKKKRRRFKGMTMITKNSSKSSAGDKREINLIKKKPDLVVKKEWEVNKPGNKRITTRRTKPANSSGTRPAPVSKSSTIKRTPPEKKVEKRDYTLKSPQPKGMVLNQIGMPEIKVKRKEKKTYSKKPTGGKKFKVSNTRRLFKPGKGQRKQACKTRKCLDLAR